MKANIQKCRDGMLFVEPPNLKSLTSMNGELHFFITRGGNFGIDHSTLTRLLWWHWTNGGVSLHPRLANS